MATKTRTTNRTTKKAPRRTYAERRAAMIETGRETLAKATTGESFTNYDAIFAGFIEKGISEGDILPRENVFTYAAWIALNRQVRKGEKGVKVITKRTNTKTNEDGSEEPVSFIASATVFHISQTDPIEEKATR